MKTFFVILILLLLTACRTQYELTIERDGLTIKGKSSSYREYALFSMEYNPATHDISLIAVGVTDDTAEVVRDVVAVGGDVVRDVVAPVHGEQDPRYTNDSN